MAELLLELLSEEIPARLQARAADDLRRLVCNGLKEAGLAFDKVESFSTPRRLTLVVDGLPEKQPDQRIERKGPRVDAPEKAIQGFLKSTGLTLDKLVIRETPKGAVYFAVENRKGRATSDVLPFLLFEAINFFNWPKSMCWAETSFLWVRPLHSILAIFGGELLRGGLGSNRKKSGASIVDFIPDPNTCPPQKYTWRVDFSSVTRGHRFLAPQPFEVRGFAEYRERLRDAYVMLDAAERRRVIEQDAARLAEAEGLRLRPDPALVAENAGLVEWPVVLAGAIPPAFMDLPAEVLTTAMRHHLKHFALIDEQGALAPRFLVVANMQAGDGGAQIIAGNERVLRARLADAKFFWDHDRKRTLESRVEDLDGVVFHAKLGSLGDKARRIAALAREMATYVPEADADLAERAARLAKADLTTDMVGEFPELQGVMGRYYALGDGEPPEVADAIAEHYAPQGPDDDCPTAPISVCVALADKIDTLVGFWAIDEKPTGSKDPYALRRAALGVIRLIIESGLRVRLLDVFLPAYDQIMVALAEGKKALLFDAGDLLGFFADRLKVHLREKGVRHDLISAVFAAQPDDDLVRLLKRVDALDKFLTSDDGEHLLTAYRRAANIVRIEQKKRNERYDEAPNPELLREADEKIVAETLSEVAGRSGAALADERFAEAMAALATLRTPVDAFFDNVTVNCDEPELRENRLRLLSRIQATMNAVADFSKIEG